MKLLTPVEFPSGKVRLTPDDHTLVIGSCFADNAGILLQQGGFKVLANPFGTLYNPLSVLSALERLSSGTPFIENEVVEMGAGAGMVSSYSHHSSFARKTAQEFLENANRKLKEACEFWKKTDTVIITLGTIYCYYHNGAVVSNCLKRPAKEFERRPMSIEECSKAIEKINGLCWKKKIIWTVSPIRHLSDGAHQNALSKSTLLISIERSKRETDDYFPAFEIMTDELRDYRFYDEDMVHPSKQAAGYIFERFLSFAVPDSERPRIETAEKDTRRQMHRAILKK